MLLAGGEVLVSILPRGPYTALAGTSLVLTCSLAVDNSSAEAEADLLHRPIRNSLVNWQYVAIFRITLYNARTQF